jgi:ubiquinone/menaquinone biosynthesis C-methylase UbiE
MSEEYCFKIGEEGQLSLDLVDKTFNSYTEYFLNKNGLRPGMQVLDIGCGLGTMTHYLARQVGETGFVTAIDNNQKQVLTAKKHCPAELQNRIDWQVGDIYALDKLNKKFDLVYCRFLIHHVHKPRFALSQISHVLNPNGLFIGGEGVVNYAFSYPAHPGWGPLNLPLDIKEGEGRNGNIGKIIPRLINENNMMCTHAEIFQPIIIDPKLRKLILQAECFDSKDFQIKNNLTTEEGWELKKELLSECIADTSIVIGEYAACFFAALKS